MTPEDRILTIRRTRPGAPVYWVLPGGHVEPTDATLEAALVREVEEELGGRARPVDLLGVVDDGTGPQHIYLARIDSWSLADATGPEHTEPGRGLYEPFEVEATTEA
ncbi:NUDIX domain-containing protein [Streptomyces roseolus]|uniref:NUDIX domain-containing protein n=1 Tax=Streptomyces roseolus TaxID=67358 RepID=UPI00378D9F61